MLSAPLYLAECADCRVDASLITQEKLHALALALETDPALAHFAGALEPSGQSTAVAVGGLVLGAGAATVGLLRPTQTCRFSPGGVQTCDSSLNVPMLLVAGGITALGLAGAWMVHQLQRPEQGEVVRALNAWNAQHPERPVLLESAPGKAPAPSSLPAAKLVPDLRDGD